MESIHGVVDHETRLRWLARSMEWWSFELLVLLSGLLPNPKLETAVLSIWSDLISVLP
jgi:hypothetical protein